MREIKFRAWIRDGEWEEDGSEQKYCMVYGDELAYEECEPLNDMLAGTENLMQFTGLKDKNGKDIYEGDVFSHYVGSNDYPIRVNVVVEIVNGHVGHYSPYYNLKNLNEGHYAFRQSDKIEDGVGYQWNFLGIHNSMLTSRSFMGILGNTESIFIKDNLDVKVIGNIHENPELLSK